MKREVQDKPKYCIQSNDGRYVSQQGFTPVLTTAPALAYTWSTAKEAEARLAAYLSALKHTGILALAVQPYHRASDVQKKTFKITARVEGMKEPFVDWYDCETQEQARQAWLEDARRYGVPEHKTSLTIEEKLQ